MSTTDNLDALRRQYLNELRRNLELVPDGLGFFSARISAAGEQTLSALVSQMEQIEGAQARAWAYERREETLRAASSTDKQKRDRISELQQQYLDRLEELDRSTPANQTELDFADTELMRIYAQLDDIATPIGVDMDTWVEQRFAEKNDERDQRLHPRPKPQKPQRQAPKSRRTTPPPPPPLPPSSTPKSPKSPHTPQASPLQTIRDKYKNLFSGYSSNMNKNGWKGLACIVAAITILALLSCLYTCNSSFDDSVSDSDLERAHSYIDKGKADEMAEEYRDAYNHYQTAERFAGDPAKNELALEAFNLKLNVSGKMVEQWLDETKDMVDYAPEMVIKMWNSLPSMEISATYKSRCMERLAEARKAARNSSSEDATDPEAPDAP